MNICGTDRDPAGVTCAAGYQQFTAARQEVGPTTPGNPGGDNSGNQAVWLLLAAAAAVLLLRR